MPITVMILLMRSSRCSAAGEMSRTPSVITRYRRPLRPRSRSDQTTRSRRYSHHSSSSSTAIMYQAWTKPNMAIGEEGAKVVVNYSSSRDAAEEVVAAIQGPGGIAMAVGANVSKEVEAIALMDVTERE